MALGICLAGNRCPYKQKTSLPCADWSFFVRIEPARTESQHRHPSVFVYVLSSGDATPRSYADIAVFPNPTTLPSVSWFTLRMIRSLRISSPNIFLRFDFMVFVPSFITICKKIVKNARCLLTVQNNCTKLSMYKEIAQSAK